MSRLTPVQGLLLNLAEKIHKGRREYLTKEQAYLQLKAMTGKDFGYDVSLWKNWFDAHAKKETKNK